MAAYRFPGCMRLSFPNFELALPLQKLPVHSSFRNHHTMATSPPSSVQRLPRRRTSSVHHPRPVGHRQGLPAGYSEGCGGARARLSLARCRFVGVGEIARFRSRGSLGPPEAPSGPGERFRTPPWLPLCGGH